MSFSCLTIPTSGLCNLVKAANHHPAKALSVESLGSGEATPPHTFSLGHPPPHRGQVSSRGVHAHPTFPPEACLTVVLAGWEVGWGEGERETAQTHLRRGWGRVAGQSKKVRAHFGLLFRVRAHLGRGGAKERHPSQQRCWNLTSQSLVPARTSRSRGERRAERGSRSTARQ